MKNKLNVLRKATLLLLGIAATGFMASCEDWFDYELPEEGSKEDTVFPEANFSYTADQEDFRIIYFTDLSTESSKTSWDFGDGSTSDEQDPTFSFEREGVYPVTLTASDNNDVESTITLDVGVVDELVPAFECADFLCSPRTPWAGDSGETSTFSGSGSPTPPEDNGGAKLGNTSQFLDQTILVSPTTTYEIVFWYVSSDVNGAAAGNILIEDADSGEDFINQPIPVTDQTAAYIETSYRFDTASTTENLRFYISYAGTEARFSKISIDKI